MNADRIIAFWWVMLAVLVLGASAFFIVQDTYCHGQCKHNTRCQERCIKKNGCPHWNDTGDQE